jgi:hypothetical protein
MTTFFPMFFDGTQLCAQADPETFFPTRESDRVHNSKARAICDRCHFKDDCREWAIGRDIDGIWGGTYRQERRRIAKERGITQIELLPANPTQNRSA